MSPRRPEVDGLGRRSTLRLTTLAFRLWARQAMAVLGIGRGVMVAFGLAAAAGAVLLVIGSSTLVGDLTGPLEQDPASVVPVLRSLGNGLVLSSIVIGASFGLLTADPSSMATLLQLIGADRRQRLGVLVVPTAVTTIGVSLVVNAAPSMPIVTADGRLAVRALVAASLIVLVIVTTLFGVVAHRGISQWLRRTVRLPLVHANAVGAAVVMAAGGVMALPALVPSTAAKGARRLSIGELPAQLVQALGDDSAGRAVAALALVVPLCAAVALGLRAASAEQTDASSGPGRLLYREVRTPRGRTWLALAWYELLALGRAPTTLVTGLAVATAGVLAVVAQDGLLGGLFVFAAPAIAGSVGLRATGGNLPEAWMLWRAVGRGPSWVVGKVLGAATVALLLFAMAAVPMAIGIDARMIGPLTLQVFAPAFFASLLAGTIAPVSDEQPLSTAVAGALTMAVSGGLLFGVSRILGLAALDSDGLVLLVTMVLCLALTMEAARRIRPEAVLRHQ